MGTNEETQTSILQKLQKSSWAITLAIAFLLLMQTCSIKRNAEQTRISMEKIQARVDSLAIKQDIVKNIKIEGFRTSKRMLYDNNAIVRTVVRPDDRMNEYDEEIKKLENK